MVDPSNALDTLQIALDAGTVVMIPCELNPDMQVLLDHPNGRPRLIYAQILGGRVKAVVIFVPIGPVESLPCFQIGCAMAKSVRGLGRRIIVKALSHAFAELKSLLSIVSVHEFYLDAIISTKNVASNRIAERLFLKPGLTNWH